MCERVWELGGGCERHLGDMCAYNVCMRVCLDIRVCCIYERLLYIRAFVVDARVCLYTRAFVCIYARLFSYAHLVHLFAERLWRFWEYLKVGSLDEPFWELGEEMSEAIIRDEVRLDLLFRLCRRQRRITLIYGAGICTHVCVHTSGRCMCGGRHVGAV